MQLSLSKLGQLTPVQAFCATPDAELQVFDGIKRLRAAQALSWPKVRVDVHTLDAAGAKVRLLLVQRDRRDLGPGGGLGGAVIVPRR